MVLSPRRPERDHDGRDDACEPDPSGGLPLHARRTAVAPSPRGIHGEAAPVAGAGHAGIPVAGPGHAGTPVALASRAVLPMTTGMRSANASQATRSMGRRDSQEE